MTGVGGFAALADAFVRVLSSALWSPCGVVGAEYNDDALDCCAWYNTVGTYRNIRCVVDMLKEGRAIRQQDVLSKLWHC